MSVDLVDVKMNRMRESRTFGCAHIYTYLYI